MHRKTEIWAFSIGEVDLVLVQTLKFLVENILKCIACCRSLTCFGSFSGPWPWHWEPWGSRLGMVQMIEVMFYTGACAASCTRSTWMELQRKSSGLFSQKRRI
jgi:hypothetical protein